MPVFNPPVRDITFVINELLQFEQHRDSLGYDEATPDTIEAIFEEAGRLAGEVIAPLNHPGDEQGCKLENGQVKTPDGFKEAYQQYVESGWGGLAVSEEFGGQGMPHTLAFMVGEIFSAANHSFYMYPSLSHGAFSAIETWSDEATKQRYLPKLCNCEWSGTMNLTEAHAGTDLGMIRTKAEPQADGSYRITGNKIFISAGEHDMSENIIHLVLAKLPDAPAGTKGISLFVVPKYLINEDGSVGEKNGVTCSAIEHKMGIKASATCVLDYDNAWGEMVGEPNQGLRAMFTMMNGARLGVGMEGLASAELAYQNAAHYAKDRLQGRAVGGRVTQDKPADPIIHHPDVRRMLLRARSFIEGARALAGWTALNIDIAGHHPDESEREKAEDFLSLITPVVKAFFTDEGTDASNMAVQVYGGHGYISEHGIEQMARDARISQLYEGTNGIQAMDLVGRKLGQNGGRAIRGYLQDLESQIKSAAGDEALQAFAKPLSEAAQSLQKATQWLMQNAMANPNNAGSAAVDYLRLFGIVAVASMWLRTARRCNEILQESPADASFYQNKLIVGRYFMESYVPEHSALLGRIESGCDTLMEMPAEAF